MVAIGQAEMYIKLQLAPANLKANVYVNAFNKRMIEAMLIKDDQAENIETFLYYTIHLNEALELGLHPMTMLYEACAQKKPWYEAIPLLFTAFTVEDLASFYSHP